MVKKELPKIWSARTTLCPNGRSPYATERQRVITGNYLTPSSRYLIFDRVGITKTEAMFQLLTFLKYHVRRSPLKNPKIGVLQLLGRRAKKGPWTITIRIRSKFLSGREILNVKDPSERFVIGYGPRPARLLAA